MNTARQIKLQRDSLTETGFAGLREHRLVKNPSVFGSSVNSDGSWAGMGNFVYLADARFIPKGETRMHSHKEVDVISVMVDGNISHQGSLGHGKDLKVNDVQVQRAGGEGFSHNEINPDDAWNRMIQLWVLPEKAGQAASYKVYQPSYGESTRIYGGFGDNDAFPSHTQVDVALLQKDESINFEGNFIAYITRGTGQANSQEIVAGDMLAGKGLVFTALENTQLIIIQYLGS
jgi:redox-sensitive bicupin YhaK (pirin superfamily)